MDYEKLWHELKERLFKEAEENPDDQQKFYAAMYITKLMSEMINHERHSRHIKELN